MKKPTGGPSRRDRLAHKMQSAAAHTEAEELAALEAHEARAAEIDARPAFGQAVVSIMIERSNELSNGVPNDKAISDILQKLLEEVPISTERRGQGFKDFMLEMAQEYAPISHKAAIKMEINAILDKAEAHAGPSGVELHAQNDANLDMPDGVS